MKRISGRRIIKTGVAVLITAWLCELLNWPAVFAVITAIVTIEPTISDSVKKGIVRFPASAIGSAYAVTFISLFGNSPITYTLAAVLTIFTCYKLKLHDGLLVATLTAVAMIEVIHDHFFIAFLIRLGTTTIGLVVSTFVNMFVLPPNYKDQITHNIEKISHLTAHMLKKIYTEILEDKLNHDHLSIELTKLKNMISSTSKLIQFQKGEYKYRPYISSQTAFFERMKQQAELLEKMYEKMKFLVDYPLLTVNWNEKKKDIIRQAVDELYESLLDDQNFHIIRHLNNKRKVIKVFWKDTDILNKIENEATSLPTETILLYELLAFYDMVEQYNGSYENINLLRQKDTII